MAFDAGERGRNAGLEELAAAIDWSPVARGLDEVYAAAARGEAAWPPLALFKALLLGIWYDLSDVKLAEALDDRASFRRFCGFAVSEPTPERTAFVRFRRELAARGLDETLFKAVMRQLEAKRLVVRTGTLIDATVVRSSRSDDAEAGWNAPRGRGAVKGYKAQVAADASGGMVRAVNVTAANVHDVRGVAGLLPWRPGEVYADAAYDSATVHEQIRARGGRPRTARRLNKRSSAARNAAKAAWNAQLKPIRCRIEKIFGTCKRSYGLARARYRGLARRAAGSPHLPRLQSEAGRVLIACRARLKRTRPLAAPCHPSARRHSVTPRRRLAPAVAPVAPQSPPSPDRAQVSVCSAMRGAAAPSSAETTRMVDGTLAHIGPRTHSGGSRLWATEGDQEPCMPHGRKGRRAVEAGPARFASSSPAADHRWRHVMVHDASAFGSQGIITRPVQCARPEGPGEPSRPV